jgi:hypothetical protein
MNDPFGSGWTEGSIRSKPCSISGTTRRASSTRFALATGISTFFGNKHRHPMERGIWFHFGKQEGNADKQEATPARLWAGVRASQHVLFDRYFCALLRLTRQMLNARVQHLPECLKKLDA